MAEADKTGGKQAAIPARTGRFGEDKDPNLGADTRFRPGESGNPKGRPKGKPLSAQIQEMLNDPTFIEKLAAKIQDPSKLPDPEFQGTPMKAMIATALIEAMDPSNHPVSRGKAREWLGKFGYGTKVDITSGGKRLEQAPLVVSDIAARGQTDASTQDQAS